MAAFFGKVCRGQIDDNTFRRERETRGLGHFVPPNLRAPNPTARPNASAAAAPRSAMRKAANLIMDEG